MTSWFDVDKEGLAKLVERRGKVFVLHELLQNAWDLDGARTVRVTMEPIDGRPLARLVVEDDHPGGFADFAHAYTLFAESEKKRDPTKRGRFNFGEKLVLALCETAEIESTKGTILFDAQGRKFLPRRKRDKGTVFRAQIRMTREELRKVNQAIRNVLPPDHCKTVINSEIIHRREPLAAIDAELQTEVAYAEGILRRSIRKTRVTIYPAFGAPMLYEMGIPVMELTDDPYSVDIGQKVPLTMERDAVRPSFLRDVRTVVMNAMAHALTPDQAAGKWAAEAIEEAGAEAVKAVLTKRFGEKAVIADPSDREGEDIAKSRGYTVIPGGSFSREAWDNIRSSGAVLPAGQVTPSPRPYHPDGEPLKMLYTLTESCRRFETLAKQLGRELIGDVAVDFAEDRSWGFSGTYSRVSATRGNLRVNYAVYKIHIERWILPELLRFIVHEFAHHTEQNHLAEGFHEECCRLAGKLAVLALDRPEIFAP